MKGFTLIEVLIYTALTAVVGMLMTGILLSVSQVHIRESASTEVTGQLNFVTQTIGRLVRTASNIEIDAGVSTSTIKFRMQDSAKDPTCISLVSGTIKLAEGPGTNPNDCSATTSDLTNSRVVVNALNFKKFVQYPGHDTVSYDIQITYNSQNPKAQVQRSLSSAIARVSAATFDSSLLPGNTTYEIGQSGSAWSKAYLGDGTTGSPAYTFGNDTTLGIFKVAGTSTIGFSTQGLERMRISANGNVGIGTTGPLVELHVKQASAGTLPSIDSNVGLLIENSSNNWIQFMSPNTTVQGILFGDPESTSIGRITYDHSTNAMAFYGPAGVGKQVEIDSSGNLNVIVGNVGIGTTGPSKILSLGSDADQTFWIERRTTAAGGRNLIVQAGGGGSGGTDLTGGELRLSGGISTGNVGSIVTFYTATAGTSGTTDRTPSEKVRIDNAGNVGIGTTGPANILTIQQTSATDPIADAWTVYSSKRWKENIAPLNNSLDKIMQLQGVSFNWKADGKYDIGLIAEDIGKIVPEAVAYEENGIDAKSVDYNKIVPLLIESTKEQQKKIEELENKVNSCLQK